MSAPKEVAVGSTVYFWFAANTTAGAAGDGATPLYDVRASGGAAGDAPTASGTPTLLTHANYTDGLHEIAIDTTGYTAGTEYAVFCTLTISSVNPAGFCGSFIVRAASSLSYTFLSNLHTRVGTPSDLGGGATVAANLADIEGFVDNLPADPADASDVAAAFAALNDVSAAEVNAEVVDALATDTYAETAGVPPATATLAVKVGWLYRTLRNAITVTSTKKQFFTDAGAADWEKDLSDDGTTYTETKGNAP